MATIDRIPLQRSVAVVDEQAITVRPARAQIVGALIELGIAAGAVLLIVLLFDRLPIAVLMVLLLLAIVLGPVGVLGLVYGAIGSSFVMDRAQGVARWQQGFLGMGIGTNEVVPFDRIARIEVGGDYEQELTAGEQQDVVHWDVRLVKDNDRLLTVGTVVAARPLAARGLERANRLAEALASMAAVESRLGEVAEEQTMEVTIEGDAAAAQTAVPRRRYRRVSGPPATGTQGESKP